MCNGYRKVRHDPYYVSVLTYATPAGDGVISFWKEDYIELVDLKSNTTNRLVAFQDLRDVHSKSHFYSIFLMIIHSGTRQATIMDRMALVFRHEVRSVKDGHQKGLCCIIQYISTN